jgi:Pyruvate/2-oxoacid:ferredoxin oxidoreductase gamma subunit
MVGVASRSFPDIAASVWKEVIAERLPKKVLQANLAAFEMGRALQH